MVKLGGHNDLWLEIIHTPRIPIVIHHRFLSNQWKSVAKTIGRCCLSRKMKPIFKMRINNKIPENFKHDLTKKTLCQKILTKRKKKERKNSLCCYCWGETVVLSWWLLLWSNALGLSLTVPDLKLLFDGVEVLVWQVIWECKEPFTSCLPISRSLPIWEWKYELGQGELL